MQKRLIEILDSGGYSCVIANGEEIRTFTLRGVADLHRLSKCEPHFLRGAIVADKIVGKGAAALMVSCGVAQLYCHTISEGAISILAKSDIKVAYGERVPHIINRDKSGWCPVEMLCRESDNVDDIAATIDRFINKK